MQTRTIEYKIVCEIHILHDYYLIDSAGASFFAKNKEQQQSLLNRKLQAGKYDVSKLFELQIDKETIETIKNLKLRLIPTSLGFNLAMEVKSEPQSDGSVRYRPAIPPAKNATLTIGLKAINRLFGNITSVALNQKDNKIYAFSNVGNRSDNVLSVPVSAFDSTQSYQMGDLALIGGKIQQALENIKGDRTKWTPVIGSGFVNNADRSIDTTSDFYQDWRLGFSTPIAHPFGLIQLQIQTDNPALTLITPDGYLVTSRTPGLFRAVSKKFELRFLSRCTYWRYGKADGFTKAEIDSINNNPSASFEWNGEKFVTRKPRCFAQTLTIDESYKAFPNAQPESLRAEGGRLYSDIHFSAINAFPK
ncbi:hypothetical protein [Haliscomenobacter sp.]|uniref:hypothetical protein n=1 Tax=Haliscomenobacter sp. TaxID=2717303 RepID=UPI0033652BDF